MKKQEAIDQIRAGKLAIKHDGSLEQLKECLSMIFSEDKSGTGGKSTFYYAIRNMLSHWAGSYELPNGIMLAINATELHALINEPESEFKGNLKGFPKEIIEWMLDQQEAQGNKRDVSVFEGNISSNKLNGGFYWYDFIKKNSFIENKDFCTNVMVEKDFDLFFKYYPKKQELKRGDLVWVSDTDQNEKTAKGVFINYAEGEKKPYRVMFEEYYKKCLQNKTPFDPVAFTFATKVTEPQQVEMTIQEIEKALNIQNLKIVK